MFGLFTPRCPIDLREKTWIELRMQWLIDRLASENLRSIEMITPSDEHFPDAYTGAEGEVERVFGYVCDQMGVPRESVELALFDGVRPSPFIYDGRGTALGVYEQRSAETSRHTVWIERKLTAEPLRLIATAAHELAHCILLGNGLLTGSEADHEFITDLLPVVKGLGIFCANAALVLENHAFMQGSWQSVSKAGYLPSRMFGYALAVFAWLRDEHRPAWSGHLRGDPQSALKSGLTYLRKTNDCLCTASRRPAADAGQGLASRLRSAISGVCLGALWELRRPNPPELTADEWAAVVACLDRRDSIVICETALTIAALHRPDASVVRRSLDLLHKYSDRPEVQASIAMALGTQKEALVAQPDLREPAIEELLRLLESETPKVVIAGLRALRQLGPTLDPLGFRQLMHVFRLGLIRCDESLTLHAVDALRGVCESPQKEAASFFQDDPELKGLAHVALSASFEEEELVVARLPTSASLPVPLPDWRPMEILLPSAPIVV